MPTIYASAEDINAWPLVEYEGITYAVAPRYVSPISIEDAEREAKHHKCVLPTPGLVDAIWRAADCRLDAALFSQATKNGTMKEMLEPALLERQAAKIEKAIKEWEAFHGVEAKIVAGTHKDVVTHNGKLGIYGWHRTSGKVVQDFTTRHVLSWADYSQGLRLVYVVG